MLVYIAVILCLSSSSGYCRQLDIPEPVAGLAACGIQGQMSATEWIKKHPGWVFSRVRCGVGKRPTNAHQGEA